MNKIKSSDSSAISNAISYASQINIKDVFSFTYSTNSCYADLSNNGDGEIDRELIINNDSFLKGQNNDSEMYRRFHSPHVISNDSRETLKVTDATKIYLKCFLCNKEFIMPKLLPCLHTFCQTCLEKHLPENSLTMTCPICNMQLILKDKGGVSALRPSEFIQSICNNNLEAFFLYRENTGLLEVDDHNNIFNSNLNNLVKINNLFTKSESSNFSSSGKERRAQKFNQNSINPSDIEIIQLSEVKKSRNYFYKNVYEKYNLATNPKTQINNRNNLISKYECKNNEFKYNMKCSNKLTSISGCHLHPGLKLDNYCTICQTICCEICSQLGEHTIHEVVPIQDQIGYIQTYFIDYEKKEQKKIENLHASLYLTELFCVNLDDNYNNAKVSLYDAFNRLKNIISKQEENNSLKLNCAYNEKLKELTNSINKIRLEITESKANLKLCNLVMNYGTIEEIVITNKELLNLKKNPILLECLCNNNNSENDNDMKETNSNLSFANKENCCSNNNKFVFLPNVDYYIKFEEGENFDIALKYLKNMNGVLSSIKRLKSSSNLTIENKMYFVGKEIKIFLNLSSEDQLEIDQQNIGMKNILIEITVCNDEIFLPEIFKEDFTEKLYFIFKPEIPGRTKINVNIFGVPLKNSPMSIIVYSNINKNKLDHIKTKATMVHQQKQLSQISSSGQISYKSMSSDVMKKKNLPRNNIKTIETSLTKNPKSYIDKKITVFEKKNKLTSIDEYSIDKHMPKKYPKFLSPLLPSKIPIQINSNVGSKVNLNLNTNMAKINLVSSKVNNNEKDEKLKSKIKNKFQTGKFNVNSTTNQMTVKILNKTSNYESNFNIKNKLNSSLFESTNIASIKNSIKQFNNKENASNNQETKNLIIIENNKKEYELNQYENMTKFPIILTNKTNHKLKYLKLEKYTSLDNLILSSFENISDFEKLKMLSQENVTCYHHKNNENLKSNHNFSFNNISQNNLGNNKKYLQLCLTNNSPKREFHNLDTDDAKISSLEMLPTNKILKKTSISSNVLINTTINNKFNKLIKINNKHNYSFINNNKNNNKSIQCDKKKYSNSITENDTIDEDEDTQFIKNSYNNNNKYNPANKNNKKETNNKQLFITEINRELSTVSSASNIENLSTLNSNESSMKLKNLNSIEHYTNETKLPQEKDPIKSMNKILITNDLINYNKTSYSNCLKNKKFNPKITNFKNNESLLKTNNICIKPYKDEENSIEGKGDRIVTSTLYDCLKSRLSMNRIGEEGRSEGQFINIHGICYKNNLLAVSDYSNKCVQVFDFQTGLFKLKFGSDSSTLDKNNNNINNNNNNNIKRNIYSNVNNNLTLNIEGTNVGKCFKSSTFTSSDCMSSPSGVAITEHGNFLVTDYENKCVNVYNSEGKFLDRFGVGKLQGPKGITIDPKDGKILVVDSRGCSILKYSRSGRFLQQISTKGYSDHQLLGPHFCAVNHQNNLLAVTDFRGHKIKLFDNNGIFVRHFGKYGKGEGQFCGPTGVAVDESNRSFVVADWGNSRLQRFNFDGNYLSIVDTANDRLLGPQGISSTPDGLILVADSGNHCIRTFVTDQ